MFSLLHSRIHTFGFHRYISQPISTFFIKVINTLLIYFANNTLLIISTIQIIVIYSANKPAMHNMEHRSYIFLM